MSALDMFEGKRTIIFWEEGSKRKYSNLNSPRRSSVFRNMNNGKQLKYIFLRPIFKCDTDF